MRVSLERMLKDEYRENAFKQYLSPFAIAMGTNLSAGQSFSAEARQFPHFGVSFHLMAAQIPEKDSYFLDRQGIKHPTVFGSAKVSENLIKGIDQRNLPFPVIQFHLGLFAYLEFLFRYTNWEIDDIGTIELRGIGIKYELIEIPAAMDKPFIISLLANYQNLQLDEYIESAAFGMTFNISKALSVLPITVMGGVQYTNNILTFESDKLVIGTALGSVNVDGLNGLIYKLALNYSFRMVLLHAEYNVGTYQVFSTGIGINF